MVKKQVPDWLNSSLWSTAPPPPPSPTPQVPSPPQPSPPPDDDVYNRPTRSSSAATSTDFSVDSSISVVPPAVTKPPEPVKAELGICCVGVIVRVIMSIMGALLALRLKIFLVRLSYYKRSGSWSSGDGVWVELSGKMHVLARLLAQLRQRTDDRIVLVSNYTQTLDLIAQLCRERRYPFLRLDGSTSISKRQKLVNGFNDQSKDEFAFLLSSKAGGCGLNLIGGNRLVLFDPDWNPANDKQAAARVWRDGQKKRVYIYRFLSTGTIEEKVYQRQMSKEGLQKVIQKEQTDSKNQGNFLSTEDLRDLFTFHENVSSEIHEKMNCIRCESGGEMADDMPENCRELDGVNFANEDCESDQADIGGFAGIAGCLHKLKSSEKQVGTPLEEDLGSWGHHFNPTSVPDAILQASAGNEVTFVFTNQVNGKLVPVESMVSPKTDGVDVDKNQFHQKENVSRKSVLTSRHPQARSWNSSIGDTTKNKLSASFKPLQRECIKSMRAPLEGTIHVALKPILSFGNQLPQKRLSPDHVDDDFQ